MDCERSDIRRGNVRISSTIRASLMDPSKGLFTYCKPSTCSTPEARNWARAGHLYTFVIASAMLSPDQIQPTSLISLFSYASRIAQMSIMSLFSMVTGKVQIN